MRSLFYKLVILVDMPDLSNSLKKITSTDDKEIFFPLKKGVCGPQALDITKLYKDYGLFVYDPGFVSTAACSSKITYIDGEKGILKYRGYDIEDLAQESDFLSVSYLLIEGKLPNSLELKKFIENLNQYSNLEKEIIAVIKSFPSKSSPMAILIAVFACLASLYNTSTAKDSYIITALGKIPSIITAIYRHLNNLELVAPNSALDYCDNVLNMMFEKHNSLFSHALDKILILHADHEQNASTSTVRMVASSGVNVLAALSAGVAALWGPLHGGANEKVIKMLQDINKDQNLQKFINKAKDKNDTFRLMGFGHRVYKGYDPRAKILCNICKNILDNLESSHTESALFDIAKELEKVASTDSYFIERNLYPNVDFYSGIILKALGISTEMFPMIFALARTSGWIAQAKEMRSDPEQKLHRPRQLYTGDIDKTINKDA